MIYLTYFSFKFNIDLANFFANCHNYYVTPNIALEALTR